MTLTHIDAKPVFSKTEHGALPIVDSVPEYEDMAAHTPTVDDNSAPFQTKISQFHAKTRK